MSNLLPMESILQSTDKDVLWAQIRIRVDLANQCVGTLYKSILADQIAVLYEHRDRITGKFIPEEPFSG